MPLATLLGGLLGCLLPSGSVAAEEAPPVRLTLPIAGLPFSSAELEAAVENRLAIQRGPGPATEVTVTPTPTPGNIVVVSRHRLEEVSVAGKAPAEAARLIALAVVAVTRPVASSVAVAAAAPASGDVGLTARAEATPSRGDGHWRLGARTGVSHGLPTGDLASESMIDFAMPFGALRVWEVTGSLGYARVAAANFGPAVVLNTIPMRLGLQRRWDWLAVGAGSVIRWYDVAGSSVNGGAVPGGTAHVAADLPLTAGFLARAAIACDAYLDEVIFRSNGREVIRTARFMPWLGVGLLWGPSS
jgi:hypothetical protein